MNLSSFCSEGHFLNIDSVPAERMQAQRRQGRVCPECIRKCYCPATADLVVREVERLERLVRRDGLSELRGAGRADLVGSKVLILAPWR
jgi:hypothetical protein